MTTLPRGFTTQDLQHHPPGYNPYAQEALTNLSGDQETRSFQLQGQTEEQNLMTAQMQRAAQGNRLVLATLAQIQGDNAPAKATMQASGAIDPTTIARYIGLR